MYIAPHFLGCVTAVTQAAVLLIPLENVHHPQLETTHIKKKKRGECLVNWMNRLETPRKLLLRKQRFLLAHSLEA